jgi:hypothetical protein
MGLSCILPAVITNKINIDILKKNDIKKILNKSNDIKKINKFK